MAITVFYSGTVLILAGLLGLRLHDWARQRIVDSSIVAWANVTKPTAPVAAQPAVPAAAAGQSTPQAAAQAVQTAEPEVQPINILVLGTDHRPDETDPGRTDTMILLSVNPVDRSVGLLSMPRDLWVPIPGQSVTTKINTAYVLGEVSKYPGGGPQLAKDTVSSFIGRPVDYYVRVNFDGFREIVDLIGGIDVNVPYAITDDQYPTENYGVETFHLDAGSQHLDGATALKYARTRHADDDYNRARRQQDIIRAVAERVLNANLLPQLLPKVPQMLITMRNSVQTDVPIPLGLQLANLVNGSSLKAARQLVLDNHYGTETYSADGAWILLPDRARVRVAVENFFRQSTSAGGAASANSAAASGQAKVEVLNGTSQPGIAARTAQLLEQQGWQVVSIGDADRKDYGQTIVINYKAPDALVRKMTSDLNLGTAQASLNGLNAASAVDLRVVVGSDLLAKLR